MGVGVMAEKPQLINVQIDGVWHQFPRGTRVIEACAKVGAYVPRYCYHPKLSSPGNCRMCLIEMGLPRMGPDRKFELGADGKRSEEHTSELQSHVNLVCRLLLEKKKRDRGVDL